MTKGNNRTSIGELKNVISTLFSNQSATNKQCVGIEVEFTPFRLEPKKKYGGVPNFKNDQHTGILDLLREQFSSNSAIWYSPNKEGTPRFLTRNGGMITFEPGGQVEYSSSASDIFSEVVQEVTTYLSVLNQILSKASHWLFFGGLNPWYSVSDIGLKLDKHRYIQMDRFFKSIGPYGQKMMRLSSSTQINLDVGDEEVMMERWTAGSLLTPIITAIFGNSPFFTGTGSGVKSYRTMIWQNLDHSRTGIIGNPAELSTLSMLEKAYYDFAMKAKVIILPDQNGDYAFHSNQVTFSTWLENGYNGFYPSVNDWENHLTTLFPEIRPKGFFEFRAFDGQASAWWLIPVLFLCRLLYDSTSRIKIIDLLKPYADQLANMQWRASIMGVSAFPELCQKTGMLALRSDQFRVDDSMVSYLEKFIKRYTLNGINPADELLSINDGEVFTASQYLIYQDQLLETINPPKEILWQNHYSFDSSENLKMQDTVPAPAGKARPCC